MNEYDIALFSTEVDIVKKPLSFGEIFTVQPGDKVFYVGYKIQADTAEANVATVMALGQVINEGAIVNFLEFEGVGLPGFSGGPVFNTKGNVIAIMREAWTKKGIKGGTEMLVNRAFSIKPLIQTKIESSKRRKNNR